MGQTKLQFLGKFNSACCGIGQRSGWSCRCGGRRGSDYRGCSGQIDFDRVGDGARDPIRLHDVNRFPIRERQCAVVRLVSACVIGLISHNHVRAKNFGDDGVCHVDDVRNGAGHPIRLRDEHIRPIGRCDRRDIGAVSGGVIGLEMLKFHHVGLCPRDPVRLEEVDGIRDIATNPVRPVFVDKDVVGHGDVDDVRDVARSEIGAAGHEDQRPRGVGFGGVQRRCQRQKGDQIAGLCFHKRFQVSNLFIAQM